MKLTWQDFEDAAITLDCDISAIRAVCEVEAPKGGFNPDGTPVTLFEGHKFYKYTNGKYAIGYPDLCYPVWTKAHYGKTWQQEQARLKRAIALDRDAALMSASWGKFQIMGFNHHLVGFNTIGEFVTAMYKDERSHLMAFVAFVQKTGLSVALRNHDWTGFARGYNGSGFAANGYDVKMAATYAKFAGEIMQNTTEAVTDAIEATPTASPTILSFIMAILKFFTRK